MRWGMGCDGTGWDRIDKIYTIGKIDKIGNIYRYR